MDKLDKLNIPNKICAGFQKRDDTYTGKLAYVTYYDAKGILRKEKSWNGWRDTKISPQDFDNSPTEGFVINRNVGGVNEQYGWNVRHEYARVYDPRGFEFEISFANLLFILQECTSTKGKGLEGEFVYAWSGTQLALLPVKCEEYNKSISYTSVQKNKMNKEDMIEGHIYLTKDLQEVMYLGKHMWYGTQYLSKVSSTNSWAGKLKYIFLPTSKIGISIRNINRYIDIWNNDHYIITSDYKKIASKISDDVSPEFANEYTKFKQCWRSSAPVKLVLSPININRIKKDEYFSHHGVFTEIYGETLCGSFWKKRYENNYLAEFDYKVKIHNESIMTYGHSQKPYVINDISIEDLQQKVFDCFVEFQNGSKIRLSEIV